MNRNSCKKLNERGIKSKISLRTRIARPTVSAIFHGKRRATPSQAEKLEAEFIRRQIPLDRWDLLYGIRVEEGQSLQDYLSRKKTESEK